MIALLSLPLLRLVLDTHLLRQTLWEEGKHHDENHDREDGSHDAGKKERTRTDPRKSLNKTWEIRLGITQKTT